MKTTEGNKLIAEFIGFNVIKISPLVYVVNGYKHTLLEEPSDYHAYFLDLRCNTKNIGHVKFHKSWDWLMPVVEKIGDENILTFDISTVWENVIEHIEWYNKQNQ